VDSSNIAPNASSAITVDLNLDAAESAPAVGTFSVTNPNSYTHSTSTTIYDSLGNSHLSAMYYVKAGAAVTNTSGAGGVFTTAVSGAASETTSLVVDGVTAFTNTSGGAAENFTAADADTQILANTAALNAAGIIISGTVAGGDLDFSRADGTSFGIVAAYGATGTAGGFAGGDYAAGTNTVNNGSAATENTWDVHTFVDGTQVDSGADTLTFTTAGALSTPAGGILTTNAFTPTGGGAPITLTSDYSGVTQFGAAFGVNSLTQDGYTTGRLSGLDIDGEGVIFARYTNGQSAVQGQIALADFPNVQGLQPVSDTSWAETYSSGAVTIGAPGTASLGLIQSGALEQSNTDLSEELVNMIIAQRSFQANAEVISTSDTITQSIINLR